MVNKIMTQQDLSDIPIIKNSVALWVEEDQPTTVIDTQGRVWMLGAYEGTQYRREMI